MLADYSWWRSYIIILLGPIYIQQLVHICRSHTALLSKVILIICMTMTFFFFFWDQILSNGIYKSPLHRVTTNAEKIRSSVAVFIEPAPEQEIGPVEEVVAEKRPKLYKTVKNYGAFNYECFQKGIVALEAVKI